MAGNEVAKREQASQALTAMTGEQLKFIANTDFVPKAYRGNLPAIMACVAMGREMGLGDMEALRQIHVIDGRPSMAAELMVKRARQSGHSIQFEQGDGWAKAKGKRGDNGDTFVSHWTFERAKAMGLLSKSNWQKMPETMLLWRAASELCRILFPDTLSGVIYTPDEAEMTPEEKIDETIGQARPVQDDGPDDSFGPVEDAELVADESDWQDAVEVDPEEQTSFADMVPASARKKP